MASRLDCHTSVTPTPAIECDRKRKSRSTTSGVWNFFQQTKTGATCRLCGLKYRVSKSASTSNMLNHISRKHSQQQQEASNAAADSSSSSSSSDPALPQADLDHALLLWLSTDLRSVTSQRRSALSFTSLSAAAALGESLPAVVLFCVVGCVMLR
jgi:hypothetical protein